MLLFPFIIIKVDQGTTGPNSKATVLDNVTMPFIIKKVDQGTKGPTIKVTVLDNVATLLVGPLVPWSTF